MHKRQVFILSAMLMTMGPTCFSQEAEPQFKGKIAKKYGTTVSALASLNGLRNASRIKVGQILRVPAGSGGSGGSIIYIVRAGDTLYDIARKFSCSVSDIMRQNNLRSSRIKIGDKLTISRM